MSTRLVARCELVVGIVLPLWLGWADTCLGSPDLTLTLRVSPDPVSVGELLTYQLSMTNRGNATATGVTLVSTFSSSARFFSASVSQGTFTQGVSSVTCQLGALDAGAAATVRIVLTPFAIGSISNSVVVTEVEADATPADNSAAQNTLVVPLTFYAAGGLVIGRQWHTATRLHNGKVLVAGGLTATGTTYTAELYDPATGTSQLTGNLNFRRVAHAAALLNDGRVLIVGHSSGFDGVAEIYDPAMGTFTTHGGSINPSYQGHAATLLTNGKVLVTGGYGIGGWYLGTAEVFEPVTGQFSAAPTMSALRSWHTATRLNSGAVLIAGGEYFWQPPQFGDIYDATASAVTQSSNTAVISTWWNATLLLDGRVLLSGWNRSLFYDPATTGFSNGPSLLNPRWRHGCGTMPDGSVLVCGGWNGSPLISAEVYSPATGRFTRTVDMLAAREYASFTQLADGRMLVIGGAVQTPTGTVYSAGAEIYDPARTKTPPLIHIDNVTGAEDAGPLQFNVWLSTALGVTASVHYAISPGSAAADADFIGSSGTVVFPPSVTNLVVSVPIVAEQVFEPDETFTVALSDSTYALIGAAQATGTIANDDMRPGLTVLPVSVPEGNAYTNALTFQFVLSAPSSETISVNCFTQDGSAVAGMDYFATNDTLTFVPGESNLPFSVILMSDIAPETDKVFYLRLTNEINATLTASDIAGTILNDDGLPGRVEHFDLGAVPSPQHLRVPFPLTITARDAFGQTATEFSGGVTLWGTLTNVPEFFLDFSEGDFSQWTPLQPQGTPGPYEIAPFDVAGRGGASLAFRILPDWNAPDGISRAVSLLGGVTYALSADVASFNEDYNYANGYPGQAAIQVNGQELTNFNFNAFGTLGPRQIFRTNLTAIYTAPASGTYQLALVFTRGIVQQSVWNCADNVRITPAAVPPRWLGPFTNGVWSGNVSAGLLATGLAFAAQAPEGYRGTGNQFDVGPAADLGLTATNTPALPRAGSDVTFVFVITNRGPSAAANVVLTNWLDAGMTFRSTTMSQGSFARVGDTVRLNFGSIANGRTANASITAQPYVAGTTTNLARLNSEIFEPNLADNLAVTVVNADFPLLHVADVSMVEGDSGTNLAAVSLWLDGPVGHTLSLDYATTGGSALAGGDYIAVSGTLILPPDVTTQYIFVPILGDILDEANETVTLSLSNPTNATLNQMQCTLTIVDNDPLPTVSIADASVVEGNSGATNVDFVVTLSNPSGSEARVSCRTSNGTATSPNDYANTTTTLVFPPGSTSRTFSVPVVGDTNNELNQTLLAVLFAPVNCALGRDIATGAIVNDDAAPGRLIRFAFDPIDSPQYQSVPLAVTVRALDHLNQPVPGFTGPVTLTAQTDGFYTQRLLDDFEDGDLAGWTNRGGALMHVSNVNDVAAVGARSLRITGRGQFSNFAYSLRRILTNSRPNHVSFRVRAAQTNANTARMWAVGGAGYPAFDFYLSNDGRMGLNTYTGFTGVPYESHRWYWVDLDLDWIARRANCRVDGSLVISNVPFPDNPYSGTDYIAIQNTDTSTSWFDEIHVFDSYPSNLVVTPTALNGFSSGVWTGNVTVSQSTSNAYFAVTDNGDHFGQSSTFDLLPLSNFPQPRLRFPSASPLSDAGLDLVLECSPGFSYRIEASTNLVNWVTISNLVSTNAILPFRDSTATSQWQRFYRAVVP